MAKKKPARPTAKKAKPSKPPKGTGGGGAVHDCGASLNMDSGPENFSALDVADEYQTLLQDAKRRAAELSEQDRASMRARGDSDEEIMADDGWRLESEIKEAEKEASDKLLLRRIERGEVRGENPGDIVRAVMLRIYSLLNDERRTKEGQHYLADVVSQIISARSVNPKTVWPWIAEHLKSEGFKLEWEYNRRKTPRGLNRLLFTFCIRRIAILDCFLQTIVTESGLLNAATPDALRAAVDSFRDSVRGRQYAPGKIKVLEAVLERHVTKWYPFMPDFYIFQGSEWRQWQRHGPLECVKLVLPFLIEEWHAYETANQVEIARLKNTNKLPKRLAPSDLKREFGKYAKVIFLENTRYDRIEMPKGRQDHFILKFT